MLTIQNERIRVNVSTINSKSVSFEIYFIDFDRNIPEDELVDVGNEKFPRYVFDNALICLNYSIKNILSADYYDADFVIISNSFLTQIIIEALELISQTSTFYEYFLEVASS